MMAAMNFTRRLKLSFAAGICVQCATALAQEPSFPAPPADFIELQIRSLESEIQKAFLLPIQTYAIGEDIPLVSFEVRCKAPWGTKAVVNTSYPLKGGWPTGKKFCRAEVTPLEGPSRYAGAGWVRSSWKPNAWVRYGCTATGGHIMDRYKSWVRARIDIFVTSMDEVDARCQKWNGAIGHY